MLVNEYFLYKGEGGGVGKPSLKGRLAAGNRPETRRANLEQGEYSRNRIGGPNPCVLQDAGMT